MKKIKSLGFLLGVMILSIKTIYGIDKIDWGENPAAPVKKTVFVQIGINYSGDKYPIVEKELKGCGNDIWNFFEERCYPQFVSKKLTHYNSEFYVLTDFLPYTFYLQDTLQNFAKGSPSAHEKNQQTINSKFIDIDNTDKPLPSTHLVFGLPTRANIEKVIQHVVAKPDMQHLVLQYSGHGGRRVIVNNQGEWKYESVIIPLDSYLNGEMSRYWFQETVINPLSLKRGFIGALILMDCCDAGGVFALSHQSILQKKDKNSLESEVGCNHILSNYFSSQSPNILVLSACKANQDSTEILINGTHQGVFTYKFLKICQELSKTYTWSLNDLSEKLYGSMQGFKQSPQLSAGFCLFPNCKDSVCQNGFPAENPIFL